MLGTVLLQSKTCRTALAPSGGALQLFELAFAGDCWPNSLVR
jgi:hypothetical protein